MGMLLDLLLQQMIPSKTDSDHVCCTAHCLLLMELPNISIDCLFILTVFQCIGLLDFQILFRLKSSRLEIFRQLQINFCGFLNS